jgi:histidyl-tRNA synthetase
LNYANKLKVPFVIIIGEEEIKNNTVTIKNMETGEQIEKSIYEL